MGLLLPRQSLQTGKVCFLSTLTTALSREEDIPLYHSRVQARPIRVPSYSASPISLVAFNQACPGKVRPRDQGGRDHSLRYHGRGLPSPRWSKDRAHTCPKDRSGQRSPAGHQHRHVRSSLELGDLGISRESFEKALAQSFAKKPKLVPLNLEIFKLGSEAARKEVGAKLKVAVVAR